MKKRILFSSSCLLLSFLLLAAFVSAAQAAVPKTLVLEQAQTLAMAADPGLKKKNNQIVVKRMKYIEAVASTRAKAKNITSFRWTPLLSFKFPQKLDLIKDYDLTIKPLTLQTEITTLIHQRDDMVYEVKRKTAQLFTDIYVYQERITFNEQLLGNARQELARNQAKLLLGTASQADIDTMQKSVDTLISDIALLKRGFENAKDELSDMMKLDVTSGYTFKNPLKTATITRAQLQELVDYTLENDHDYYAARMAESVARLNLDSYEKLFRAQYGGKVDAVAVFLQQARSGQSIDTTAFKDSYAAMLKTFDAPWDGRVTILFFTFTMEWLKGEISGTRYIEEEQYALYTAALDYVATLKDKEAAEKALRKQISSQYETLVTAKNAVDALLNTVSETRAALMRISELNRLGRAEYSELKDKQDDYQSIQADAVEALATFNGLLFEFDRLTCGGVTKLLNGTGLGLDAGVSGDSNKELPMYYIYTDMANMVFTFGINIPDDYEPEVDSFEIWYEGTQIGVRTPAAKALRHLALDYGESSMLTVRLFNGDEYIDECEIDTAIPTDVLKISGGVAPAVTERVLGSYTITSGQTGGVSLSELSLTVSPGVGAAYYRLSLDGKGLFTGERLPVSQSFKYLTLLAVSLDMVRVELYDADGSLLCQARCETSAQRLIEVLP